MAREAKRRNLQKKVRHVYEARSMSFPVGEWGNIGLQHRKGPSWGGRDTVTLETWCPRQAACVLNPTK